jgi:membrane protein
VRILGLQGLGFFTLGERSIRNFYRHRMTTYAAALAYRALFALFPFTLLVVMLLGVLDLGGFFDRILEQSRSEPAQPVSTPLEPAVDEGRQHVQLLESLIEQARRQAGGGLISFGVAASLYSVYVAARTLTEAMNAAYEVAEMRPGWKRSLLSAVFGPALALLVIVAVVLMLVGPEIVGWIAGLVGLDAVFVALWGWLRLPVALFLLAAVLSIVYRFVPDVDQSYRLVTPGAGFAVVAWVVTSLGFSLYLAYFAHYGATYGSLGAAIGLLFYLYLSASVVLLGAEVNVAISHSEPDRTSQAEKPGSNCRTADAHRDRSKRV